MIGHVSVELVSGERREHVGMTNADYRKVMSLLLHEAAGLAVLLYGFKGRLEETADVDRYLARHRRSGRLSFVRFELNALTIERLWRYLEEYRTLNVGKIYGLPHRPLHGEGAGCSAFAASFLEVSGLLDEDLRERWTRTIFIPDHLVGGKGTSRRISLARLLLQDAAWAEKESDQVAVYFWDPDLMHRWVYDVAESRISPPKRPYRPTKEGGILGMIIDARDLVPPTTGIWQRDLLSGRGI